MSTEWLPGVVDGRPVAVQLPAGTASGQLLVVLEDGTLTSVGNGACELLDDEPYGYWGAALGRAQVILAALAPQRVSDA